MLILTAELFDLYKSSAKLSYYFSASLIGIIDEANGISNPKHIDNAKALPVGTGANSTPIDALSADTAYYYIKNNILPLREETIA